MGCEGGVNVSIYARVVGRCLGHESHGIDGLVGCTSRLEITGALKACLRVRLWGGGCSGGRLYSLNGDRATWCVREERYLLPVSVSAVLSKTSIMPSINGSVREALCVRE